MSEPRSGRTDPSRSEQRSATRARLDQPRIERRGPRMRYDPEAFGRLTERIARFLGTGRYLVVQTAIIILWVVWNIAFRNGPLHFDKYPFIFLTLILSLQASYAAPLILLAQNRQEARDRVTQEHDRDANAQAHADMGFLAREVASLRLGIGEVATRDFIRGELRNLLTELEERADDA